jgi:hypothetical protein
MVEVIQGFRKKQAIAVILVFACIVAAFLTDKASVSVGAIMAACGLCYWAARLQPEPPPDEHHH